MNLMQAGPSELSEQFVVCVFLCVLMRSSVYQLLSVPHLGTSVVQRGGLLSSVGPQLEYRHNGCMQQRHHLNRPQGKQLTVMGA